MTASFSALSLLFILLLFPPVLFAKGTENDIVIGNQFPKALYFRYVENSAASIDVPYERWVKRWSKLDGIVAKGLNEEIPNRSDEALRKFLLFKKENPSKLLLLHFNGTARDPRFNLELYHPLDWTYYTGTTTTGTVLTSDSLIHVKNPSVFRTHQSESQNYNDDAVLVPKGERGDLDWGNAEYIKVLKVDHEASIIHVQRRAFRQSSLNIGDIHKAYIAPIVTQPPQARGSKQPLWRYNFSSQSMPSKLASELGGYFMPEGELDSFDGIEFDVLVESRGMKHHSRENYIDYVPDGVFDEGDRKIRQRYASGVYDFLTQLRERLGSEKLILADGGSKKHPRAFHILNGIESEYWPAQGDNTIEQWSTGINRHLFWRDNSVKPSFNYIKLGPLFNGQGKSITPSNNIRRLIIAGSLFTGSAIAPAYRPSGYKLDNWPELTGKRRYYSQWLGKPLGEVNHFVRNNGALHSSTLITGKGSYSLPLKGSISILQEELEVELSKSSDILITVSTMSSLNYEKDEMPWRGERYYLRTQFGNNLELGSFSGTQPFTSTFFFKSVPAGKQLFTLETEQEGVSISSLSIETGTYIPFREFEHGIVIANPAHTPASFTLKELPLSLKTKSTISNKRRVTIPEKDASVIQK